jgi:hypothetical protein
MLLSSSKPISATSRQQFHSPLAPSAPSRGLATGTAWILDLSLNWLDITDRYPFLRYAELFTATGGCSEGFGDKRHNKTCGPWFIFDAPRAPMLLGSAAPASHAIDNTRAAGLHPYLVTGNVPVAMSKNPSSGAFGVNTQLPDNTAEYSLYTNSFAAAALTRCHGAAELQQWKWGSSHGV